MEATDSTGAGLHSDPAALTEVLLRQLEQRMTAGRIEGPLGGDEVRSALATRGASDASRYAPYALYIPSITHIFTSTVQYDVHGRP